MMMTMIMMIKTGKGSLMLHNTVNMTRRNVLEIVFENTDLNPNDNDYLS